MNIKKIMKYAASLGVALLVFIGEFSFQTFATEESEENSVSFEVKLEIQGDAPDDEVPFTFIIDPENDAPLPDTNHVTIVGEGTESFAEITFTKPGEYIYTVYERNDGVDNYIYDDSVYYIHEEVSYDSNGQLVASCSVYDDDGCGAKQPEISFINLYDDDIPIPSEESSSPQITTTPEETTPTGETETSVTENPTKSTEPSETTTSDSTDKTTGTVNNTDTPKTSDDTNNVPWVVILCVALVGMVSLNVVKYHRKKQDDRKNGQ